MGLFKKDEEEGNTTPSNLSDHSSVVASLEELEKRRAERLNLAPKKDGRGRKSKDEILQDELVKDLYKPSIWSEIGSLPFNVRKAMTGSDIFSLSKDQKDSLGVPLSMLMKTLVDIDPKYVALVVFCVNLGTIWTEKEILFAIEKKKKKKETEKEKKDNGKT